MENILKIIYDKSSDNKILNLNDIEKILEFLIVKKDLNEYISDINVQNIRSNNLASYSNCTKTITIYTDKINHMVRNIEENTISINDFELTFYKNLSILQVLLHEIEHANQQKIAYSLNTIEALIIRLSYLVVNGYNEQLYEYCPEERLAEIKSYSEILMLFRYLSKNFLRLQEIINSENLKRLLIGYHYKNSEITIPTREYFILGDKENIYKSLDSSISFNEYTLNERLKYGFSISKDEYSDSMKKLMLSLNKNFKNKINII